MQDFVNKDHEMVMFFFEMMKEWKKIRELKILNHHFAPQCDKRFN